VRAKELGNKVIMKHGEQCWTNRLPAYKVIYDALALASGKGMPVSEAGPRQTRDELPVGSCFP